MRLYEERVFVFGAALARTAALAQFADCLEGGAKGAEHRPPLPDRADDGVLHG